MPELAPEPPWTAPIQHGGALLEPLDPGPISALQLGLRGDEPLRTALSALGLDLPAAGAAAYAGEGRCLWAGYDHWLLVGVAAQGLDAHAEVTDQSDSWAVLALSGGDRHAVLARLIPVDFASQAVGATIRSELKHIPTLFEVAETAIRIYAPRSYRVTVHHDLATAMQSVAAQAVYRAG